MESLAKDPLLQYNEDTLTILRKQYNYEKKEEMDAAINVFVEWLKKQNHFTKNEYTREYLESSIILHKGSVERAKTHMDKLCTLRTMLPHFFEHCNVQKDCAVHVNDTFAYAFLPKLTSEHRRVFLMNIINNLNLSSKVYTNMFIMSVIFTEYILAYDYCDGFIMVVDLRGVNILDMVKQLNIVELRQIVAITMEGFGLRLKGIHLITTSTTIDVLTKIMKQMFSAKIASRICIHKTKESLCEFVPKEVLPVEYGGKERPLITIYEDWLKFLSTEEFIGHMKMVNQARTNEDLRLNDAVNEQYKSISGTFRTLSVD